MQVIDSNPAVSHAMPPVRKTIVASLPSFARIVAAKAGRTQPASPDDCNQTESPTGKTKRIQALRHVFDTFQRLAGKMPGSGVTSRAGMGDNLPEIAV
jgi:hypothetical protein